MKLITTLLATVLADCPRSWIVDPDDADKCIPDGINIQCNTNNMVVTFGLDHVYFEGDDFDATQKVSIQQPPKVIPFHKIIFV